MSRPHSLTIVITGENPDEMLEALDAIKINAADLSKGEYYEDAYMNTHVEFHWGYTKD
jgi:hypothetical protein